MAYSWLIQDRDDTIACFGYVLWNIEPENPLDQPAINISKPPILQLSTGSKGYRSVQDRPSIAASKKQSVYVSITKTSNETMWSIHTEPLKVWKQTQTQTQTAAEFLELKKSNFFSIHTNKETNFMYSK